MPKIAYLRVFIPKFARGEMKLRTKDNINDIWSAVTAQLRDEMSGVAFDTWIMPIVPIGITGTEIRLKVPGGLQKGSLGKSMITTKYRSLIESSLRSVTGKDLSLDVCFV